MHTAILVIASWAFTGYGRRVHMRGLQEGHGNLMRLGDQKQISKRAGAAERMQSFAQDNVQDALEIAAGALLAFNHPAAPWQASQHRQKMLDTASPLERASPELARSRKLVPPLLQQATPPRSNAIIACASDDKIASLHAWLESKGISTSAVKGGSLPGFGLSLISQGVKKGDQLLSVPASLHITPSAVRESPLGEAVSSVVPQDDESAFLALGLLQEVGKGEASELAPYIDILPKADGMNGLPLLWTDDDLATFLSGSHLRETVTNMRNSLLAQWQEIEQSVLPKHPESLFPRDAFNAPGYLWAHAICLTRAFPFGEELSLIPFFDLGNHKVLSVNKCSIGVVDESSTTEEGSPTGAVLPVTDALQLEGKEGVAVITAGSNISEGKQVFIDYGEWGWRSSWEMLYTYGFVPGEVKENWLAAGGCPIFFEGVRPDDPLLPQKQALLTALGVEETGWAGTWANLNAGKEAASAMAPLLRLAHMAPGKHAGHAGAAAMAEDLASWNADPQKTWMLLQRPLDAAIEISIAGQIIGKCEEALAKLPPVEDLAAASVPADPEAGVTGEQAAEEERARLGARVLLGERFALERCIAEWTQHQAEQKPAENEPSEDVDKPKKRLSKAGVLKL